MELPVFNHNQGNIAIETATRQQLHDEYAARLTAADGQVRAMLAEIDLLYAPACRRAPAISPAPTGRRTGGSGVQRRQPR